MTRFVACLILLLAAAHAAPLAAQPPAPAAPAVPQATAPAAAAPPVEELVALALERSPALAARRAALAATRQMELPATALPDPMVEGMLQNADFPSYTVGEEDMSMAGVEVRQGLPFPGKRRARGEASAAETAQRAAELAAAESKVAAAVRVIYGRLYALDRERQALGAARELVDMLAATAASRYVTGEAEQEALIKAQIEISRLGEQLEDLAAERAAMVAELNRWLDRPGAAPLGDVAVLPAPVPAAAAEPRWEERAVEAAPEVRVGRAATAAAERRLAVARLDLKPDFMPAAGLASRGSLGPVLTLRFGFELPLWRKQKQQPMIRAAEEELEMARQEVRDAEAMARADAARLAARLLQAERQVVRFREAIVPQTSTALEAARASYLAGRGDFSTVIEDFELWLEARVQLARRVADRFAAWAELERLTGGAQ